jgi:hypothetical protein
MHDSCKTIYPRNMVCFRYVILNTLHKGDDDDRLCKMIECPVSLNILGADYAHGTLTHWDVSYMQKTFI